MRFNRWVGNYYDINFWKMINQIAEVYLSDTAQANYANFHLDFT